MDNSSIDSKDKKVSPLQECPIPVEVRLDAFESANNCISPIITDPNTGVCYVRCVAGGKEIDINRQYLTGDRVTIDDVTFTKDPDIARQWIISGKNVGIYTGLEPRDVIEDNVVILDIDLKDVSPDEEPSFMAPREVIDRIVGRTLTIETRTGGLQCIFRNTLGITGSPKLRYIDPETGHLKDAGDTRIKHAYALFAGSYVSPDKITGKRGKNDPKKPFKKPLPHADGLYRAVHAVPVVDLTHELLEETGFVIGGRVTRAPQHKARKTATGDDGEKEIARKIDGVKAYSSYGHRRFQYELTAQRLQHLASIADPGIIRNRDGKSLENLAYTNQKLFNLIKPRNDYTTRGVTNDESESAENIALAYEMRKLGFDDPDTVAMAILLYQPREKNFEIRSNGISYLADTIAGAFDLYDFEQNDEFTEDEHLAAINTGTGLSHPDVADGRGYSHLYEVAKDDPNVRFETWTQFPPLSPDSADITLWRGDPRSGKSWHGALYLSQHATGNYITHRHEILSGIFSRLVEMTNDTTKTIVWMEGKGRCCQNKEGTRDWMSCKTCPLHPSDGEEDGGIPFLEYQREASNILKKYRAISRDVLTSNGVDYCPYYILKLAEPEADYCLAVAPFISPICNPDTYHITPREYLVIDEEPTIDVFYPGYPAIYEYHQYGFAEKWDTNHLVRDDIVGQFNDVIKVIKDKNPKRVTRINKVIREICENIITLNTEVMAFSRLQSKDARERDAFVQRVRKKLSTYEDLSLAFKQQIMTTFQEHIRDLPYPSTGNPIQYLQPFLFPAQNLLVWQQGSHPNSPKQILYLMSSHTPMFEPEFTRMLVIGATESEIFVDQIRGNRSVCRVDLEIFPFAENYTLLVAVADRPAQQEAIVRQLMARLLERNRAALRNNKPIVPFAAVTATREKQQALVNSMAPHGKIMSLGEHDTRDDVVRYYEQGYPVAFYNNGTIARGVDLPEYDILFFVDGGFATPRFTALEACAVALSDESSIKRYRNIRVSKVADECTNSVYRTSPLYTRKSDSGKILVISKIHLGLVYKSLYKDSVVIPVEIDSIDKYVDYMTAISSKILVLPQTQNSDNKNAPISDSCNVARIGEHRGYEDCQIAEPSTHGAAFQNIRDTIYYVHNVICNATTYVVLSGVDKSTMREMAKERAILQRSITRDHKAQRVYNAVLRVLLGRLKSVSHRLSLDSVVSSLAENKTLKKRRVSTRAIEQMIEDMIFEGILLCEETEDFRASFDGGVPEVKRWIRVNPNSPVVQNMC